MTDKDLCKAPNCQTIRDRKRRSTLCTMHRVRWGRHKSYDLPKKPELPFGVLKICIHHGDLREGETYFNENYGYHQCLKCKRDAMFKFEDSNMHRDSNIQKRSYQLRKFPHIRMTKQDYDELLVKQNYKCAICKGYEESIAGKRNNDKRRLAIDHNHITGQIRGLLCSFCNKGLGHLKDNIEILESAIAYLKSHS